MLIAIAATSMNNAIGKGNKIPWQSPEDMAHFRKMTLGHRLVMGRKTAESVWRLDDRQILVLSSPSELTIEEIVKMGETENIFICWGATVYEQLLPYCDLLLLSKIPVKVEGADTFMPEIKDFLGMIDIPFNSFTLEVYFKSAEALAWVAKQ